jgi:hypothetical protein
MIEDALIGAAIKFQRLDKGYKTAQALCDQIKETTGVSISDQMMYRIEKGTRPVSLKEAYGITVVLYGRSFDNDFLNIARRAFSDS